jgi:acyl-[acyl-carrier-protein]-phospholipid O-acyltransferase/long-chain-fatty-acid--[acyl-carrier-protein] ligase
MSEPLLLSRRFAPMFWCQLLSALNDNFIKNALVMLVLYRIGTTSGELTATLAGALLVVPFFLLSALGGELADKHDKAFMAERLKRAEIGVALIAGLGFLLSSVELLFVALGLFGVIAALFGPIKYGILPDQLETSELPAANALVEGATFLAILGGTILGGMAIQWGWPSEALAAAMLVLALACWLSARLILPTGAAAPGLAITPNPLRSTVRLVGELSADRRLWIGGLITSWFWFVGFVSLALLPAIVKSRLNGDESVATLGLVVFTLGIAAGSALAARASRRRPNMALVPLAALLMGLVAIDLARTLATLATPAHVVGPVEVLGSAAGFNVMLDLMLLALAGGLFIVPAFAAVQMWAPPDRRARVVAAVNTLNAAFMTLAAVLVALLSLVGAGPAGILLLVGLASLAAAALVVRAWGRDGLRDIGHFLFSTFYRLEVKGLENLPPDGSRAIIAPNHVSYMDGPVMHAILPSHAAFAIDTGIAEAWWVKPFLKLVNAHTMDPTRPLATRALANAVKGGQTVVIFPEGRLTVTGGLMKVYDGAAMIADKADAEVIPVRIEGFERSSWSYLTRGQIRKALFPKVVVTILEPVKLKVPAGLKGKARRQAAGAALGDIMVDSAVRTARFKRNLFDALIEAKETRDTGKPVVADPLRVKLTYGRLILGAQVLAGKLEPLAAEGAAVGVMLPNTAGVAVTFFALQSIGRVPAMLNYTAGPQNVVAACRAARVEVVLTSRAFVERAHLEGLVAALAAAGTRLIHLEDVRAGVTLADKLAAFWRGDRPRVSPASDKPAAILFTSGSEGTPKGVVLSHENILANAVQALTRVAAHGEDKVFNVLPVFHSFGLTAGLVMPVTGGVPVYLYPSPLHYRIVPELVYQTNATILFGTDTFLNGYAKVAHPYDFRSVRLVLAGAEAVKARTREIYMERFGVRILEGYGVTETAPVIAMNTPLANRSGTVGRLAPLMEARIEKVAGIEEGGRLFVRGPNVMLGYLRAERPGVLEPPVDGWHDTGDIVVIDQQGFITIRGRAKRFAKVGGEMVSLAAVEALAAELWSAALSVVVAVADARKGERLVLVTSEAKAAREPLMRHVRSRGAGDLMVPSEVLVVPQVPVLGSGKADYVAVARLVASRMPPPPA